jgi:hypothetical protein
VVSSADDWETSGDECKQMTWERKTVLHADEIRPEVEDLVMADAPSQSDSQATQLRRQILKLTFTTTDGSTRFRKLVATYVPLSESSSSTSSSSDMAHIKSEPASSYESPSEEDSRFRRRPRGSLYPSRRGRREETTSSGTDADNENEGLDTDNTDHEHSGDDESERSGNDPLRRRESTDESRHPSRHVARQSISRDNFQRRAGSARYDGLNALIPRSAQDPAHPSHQAYQSQWLPSIQPNGFAPSGFGSVSSGQTYGMTNTRFETSTQDNPPASRFGQRLGRFAEPGVRDNTSRSFDSSILQPRLGSANHPSRTTPQSFSQQQQQPQAYTSRSSRYGDAQPYLQEGMYDSVQQMQSQYDGHGYHHLQQQQRVLQQPLPNHSIFPYCFFPQETVDTDGTTMSSMQDAFNFPSQLQDIQSQNLTDTGINVSQLSPSIFDLPESQAVQGSQALPEHEGEFMEPMGDADLEKYIVEDEVSGFDFDPWLKRSS